MGYWTGEKFQWGAAQRMSTDQVSKDDGSSWQSWMDESKWTFIQENWGLILTVAQKWRKRGGETVDWDDIVHGAMMLAVVCLRTWDPERNAFSTYYMHAAKSPERYMHRSLFRNYNRETGFEQVHSLDKWITGGDGEDDLLVDKIAGEDDIVDLVEARFESHRLRSAIDRLPEDLKEHALNIINDEVDWNDLEHVVSVHNRTIEALREEM